MRTFQAHYLFPTNQINNNNNNHSRTHKAAAAAAASVCYVFNRIQRIFLFQFRNFKHKSGVNQRDMSCRLILVNFLNTSKALSGIDDLLRDFSLFSSLNHCQQLCVELKSETIVKRTAGE